MNPVVRRKSVAAMMRKMQQDPGAPGLFLTSSAKISMMIIDFLAIDIMV
jgi:hypothetical protein